MSRMKSDRSNVLSGRPSGVRRCWRWGLLLALLQAGCFYQYHWDLRPSGETTAWDPALRPGLPAVQVLTSEQANRPYKKIGLVHAPGSLRAQDALIVLKQEAQALRGDALINVRQRGADAALAGASGNPADQPWDAEVIVWTDPPADPVAPPSPGAPSQS